MNTRTTAFAFDPHFNFGVDTPFGAHNDKNGAVGPFPPVPGNFELLDNTPFLLLDGTIFLLL